MTTVVWHGKTRTFAVDSMCTFRKGNDPLLRNEAAYKIVDLYPLELIDRNGERLLAAAVSGDVSGINRLLKFLIEALGEWKLMARIVSDVGGAFLSSTQAASAVVITNKAAYRVTMEAGVRIDKFELDEFIAIGSGNWSAITAYRVFDVSARDAVLSATVCDDGTGFMIMTAQVTSKGLTGHHGEYFNDMKAEILKIRKKVGARLTVDVIKEQLSPKNRFGTGDNIVSEGRLMIIRKRELAKRKEKVVRKKPAKETPIPPVEAVKKATVRKKKLK